MASNLILHLQEGNILVSEFFLVIFGQTMLEKSTQNKNSLNSFFGSMSLKVFSIDLTIKFKADHRDWL